LQCETGTLSGGDWFKRSTGEKRLVTGNNNYYYYYY
jgi:hypothetical protein